MINHTLPKHLSFLTCPSTRQPLTLLGQCLVPHGRTGNRYPIHDGIPILLSDAANDDSFETLHSETPEPWDYSQRAAEILRHRSILSAIASLNVAPGRSLDVGCSRGQLTRHLVDQLTPLVSIDLSLSAVRATRDALGDNSSVLCAVASACELPFADCAFNLLFACDGLAGWNLSDAQRHVALAEFHRVLSPGGFAILTDYLHPTQFPAWHRIIEDSQLQLVAPIHFHDRLWYLMETRISHWPAGIRKSLSRSIVLAQGLTLFSRLLGDFGSNHFGLILKRA